MPPSRPARAIGPIRPIGPIRRIASLALLSTLLLAPASPAPAAPMNDDEIRGYAAAILEREFNVRGESVLVQDGVVRIRADLPESDREKLTRALEQLDGVERVEIQEADTRPVGVAWLPLHSQFKPLLADPRWPHFAASYQYYFDDDFLTSVGAVDLGETFALVRYNFENGGSAELGLQAGVFAVFDLPADSTDLVNADYIGALPITYATGNFSGMVRVMHQSSHLGDEFVLRNDIERINLSFEQIDLLLSYEFTPEARVYGGGGYIFRSEPSLQPWSTEIGLEYISVESDWGGVKPLAALDMQNWEEGGWTPNLSIRAGLQYGRPLGIGRNIQLLMEFYRGQSPNGQFYDREIAYLGLGVHLYF